MRTDVLYKVEATSSTTEKVVLLKTLAGDALTVELIRLALDPYTTFGVTMSRETMVSLCSDAGDAPDFPVLGQKVGTKRGAEIAKQDTVIWWRATIMVLEQLALRKLTGHTAQKILNNHFANAPSLAASDWAWRVLNKDLRCGVSVTLALKAFPGLVKPFEIAQAHPYRDQDIDYPGFMDPKYDGERCLMIRDKAYSRYGLEMLGAAEVFAELRPLVDAGWVFDGELYKHGRPLNQIHSAATKAEPNDLDYVIFDCMGIEHWDAQDTDDCTERKRSLADLNNMYAEQWERISVTPTVYCDTMTLSEAMVWRDHYRALGFEGSMWKKASAKYSFARTNDIIKFKMFETVDGKIVDMYEGEGKHAGRLGGLVIELDSGVQTKLGGGFSDAQREEFWALGSKMFGEYVEGTAQEGKTKNGKLRHGNFVRRRPDKV